MQITRCFEPMEMEASFSSRPDGADIHCTTFQLPSSDVHVIRAVPPKGRYFLSIHLYAPFHLWLRKNNPLEWANSKPFLQLKKMGAVNSAIRLQEGGLFGPELIEVCSTDPDSVTTYIRKQQEQFGELGLCSENPLSNGLREETRLRLGAFGILTDDSAEASESAASSAEKVRATNAITPLPPILGLELAMNLCLYAPILGPNFKGRAMSHKALESRMMSARISVLEDLAWPLTYDVICLSLNNYLDELAGKREIYAGRIEHVQEMAQRLGLLKSNLEARYPVLAEGNAY